MCAYGPDKYDPVQCRLCGHLTQRGLLNTERYLRLSLPGVRHGPAGNCEPDEYVVACPDCGAVESFEDAILCAECLDRPCICRSDAT